MLFNFYLVKHSCSLISSYSYIFLDLKPQYFSLKMEVLSWCLVCLYRPSLGQFQPIVWELVYSMIHPPPWVCNSLQKRKAKEIKGESCHKGSTNFQRINLYLDMNRRWYYFREFRYPWKFVYLPECPWRLQIYQTTPMSKKIHFIK